jgi:hypothetical protein
MTNEPTEGIDGLPGPLLLHAEQLCQQFEAAWKAGRQPAIEDFLAGMAEPERTPLLHELIEVEPEYRQQVGDGPRTEEYRGRFPELDAQWLAGVLATPPADGPGAAFGAAAESAPGAERRRLRVAGGTGPRRHGNRLPRARRS